MKAHGQVKVDWHRGRVNPRFVALAKAATRAGHDRLVCRVLDKWESLIDDYVLPEAGGAHQVGVVTKILNRHPEIDKNSRYLLCRAARNGHLDVIEQVVAADPIVCLHPALPSATFGGHRDVVADLLGKMDLSRSEDIREAYLIARVRGYDEIADLIFVAVPDLHDSFNEDLEHMAQVDLFGFICDCIESRKYLLAETCLLMTEDVCELTDENIQELLYTSENSPEMIELLLNHEILGPKIASNKTTAQVAAEYLIGEKAFQFRLKTIIQFLRNVHDFNQCVSKFLWTAIEIGNLELVEAIMEMCAPKIPSKIAQLFIQATAHHDGKNFRALFNACVACPEMAWFINHLPENVKQFCTN